MRLPLSMLALFSMLAACSSTAIHEPQATLAPDVGKRVVAQHGMVSSAHPLASEAGVEMLRRGGNAVDAAVAAGFAIGVVEPAMSSLGGGGTMLVWLQDQSRAEAVDFYSAGRAPSWRAVPPDTGIVDMRNVAVPGTVAGLLTAHERYGRLARADVLSPAIRLAEEGFPVYHILHEAIRSEAPKLNRFAAARSRFLPDGRPLEVGSLLVQPELALVLRGIAADGRDAFYEGDVARQLVDALNAGGNPTTLADVADYSARVHKRPLCGEYRGRVVLSAPPPQSGMQIIHTLNLLEPHDLTALGLPTRSAGAFDVLTSALRVGHEDRAEYVDDPDWVPVPAVGVVSKEFARTRAHLVGSGRAVESIRAGDPRSFEDAPPTPRCAAFEPFRPLAATPAEPRDLEDDRSNTTHISVVDRDGNAVALSNTIGPFFGKGTWVGGFFLNTSGYDFMAMSPPGEGTGPWRVRRSTMSPTIVLEDGRVRMVAGAPGGPRIPTAIVQAIVYTLDYGMDPLAAIRMPRIHPSSSRPSVDLEPGFSGEIIRGIQEMGYEPRVSMSGYARMYVIVRSGNHWIGAADPRHDGEVRGY